MGSLQCYSVACASVVVTVPVSVAHPALERTLDVALRRPLLLDLLLLLFFKHFIITLFLVFFLQLQLQLCGILPRHRMATLFLKLVRSLV